MRADFITVKQSVPLLLIILTTANSRAQTGNVGIGTTIPTSQLHTTGTVRHQGYSGAGTRLVQMDSTGRMVVTCAGPTFSNTTAVPIPDNTCGGAGATSSITVSGQPTAVQSSKISVRVNIAHAYIGDVLVFLTAPNGQTLVLAANHGGNTANYTNTIFSDGATTQVASGAAPYTGTFKPTGGAPPQVCFSTTYVSNFGSFNFGNIVPNGTWTLRVFDNSAIISGTLLDWSISFSGPESFATAEQANYVPYFAGGGLEASPLYRAPASGNLGIGTTTPTQKLDIAKGRLRFSGDPDPSNVQGIEFTNGGGTTLNGFIGKYNDSMMGMYGFTGAGWRFLFNNTNGNVGLQGNSNPRAPLSFASSTGNKIALWGNADGGHYGIGISAAALQIYGSDATADILLGYGSSTAFTENMRVKGNGNVGIGNNNPLTKLDVTGGIHSTGLIASDGSMNAASFFTPTGTSLGFGLTLAGSAGIGGTVSIAGGSPAVGKVLTATNSSGSATWQTPPAGRDAFRVSYTTSSGPLNNLMLADNNTALDFDDENRFNNTTQKFTAPVAGLYAFQYSVFFVTFSPATASGVYELQLYKNTTSVDDLVGKYNSGEYVTGTLNGSVIIKLAAGDVVGLGASASSSQVQFSVTQPSGNYFSGYRIY